MIMLQSLATFIGVLIGIFFAAVGIPSMVTMFINKDQSLAKICLWGLMIAFGVTMTIAILKPI